MVPRDKGSDEENYGPPTLSVYEVRQVRYILRNWDRKRVDELGDMLDASRSTKAIITFVKYTAGWLTVVIGALVAVKASLNGWWK